MKKINALKSLVLSLFLALPLVACEEPNSDSTQTSEIQAEKVTIAEAIQIASSAKNGVTTSEYIITGTVAELTSALYGEMYVSDDTGSLYIYEVYSEDGKTRYDALEEKPVENDLITLRGHLGLIDGVPGMTTGHIVEFTHIDEFTTMSIADAREVADESKVKVTGTVARITYSFGMVPSGFYLVDNSSSIYVYGENVAKQVNIGNTIKINAVKDYYVLEDEKTNADKFGYAGCCQLTYPELLENDKGNNEWDKTWVTETTVKDLIETDITENITTQIYKVNAYVNKVPGNGFTNYYIDDIDGVTGTYTYTQCNGNDFDWLEQFDGKICTVYVAAHNAKATSAGCTFRFIPISVSDDNYTFDLNKSSDFALKYYANDQFKDKYTADPALEVITSVSNEKLGVENVAITYTSSNSEVLYFANENGKTVMHTNNTTSTNVNVTITATYNGISASVTKQIYVEEVVYVEGVTVAEAIATADGEEVQVKGIVGASLVNRDGFYLIDETGLIAIICTTDILNELELGYEVVIKGTRGHNKKPETLTAIGQSFIGNTTLVANYYGNHTYSTATFDSSKTIDELYDFDALEDYSAQGYIVNGTVLVEETAYYTNILIKDINGSNKLRLYCSSASQYNWLKEYAGKEVTFHLALCNWNDKNYYTGCVLAVVTSEGTVVNNYNFK